VKSVFISFSKLEKDLQLELFDKIALYNLNCTHILSASSVDPALVQKHPTTTFLTNKDLYSFQRHSPATPNPLYLQLISPNLYRLLPLVDRHIQFGASFFRKQTHLVNLFSRLQALLENSTPDCILFSKEPETDTELALSLLSDYLGIKTIYSRFGLFDHARFLSTSWHAPPTNSDYTYHSSVVMPKTISSSSLTKKAIHSLIHSNKNYTPPAETHYRTTANIIDDFRIALKNFSIRRYLYRFSNNLFHESEGLLHKNRIFIAYKQASSSSLSFSENELKVYFPLHYQPELNTTPVGDLFANQFLAIKALSDSLPSNSRIYVKEHPATFNLNLFQSSRFRYSAFYSQLKSITRVILCPIDTPSIHLQQSCDITATISGSAGIEAMCLRKKVFVFGSPIYQYAPNVFLIRNHHDIVTAVNAPLLYSEELYRLIDSFVSITDYISIKLDSSLPLEPGIRDYMFRRHLLDCLVQMMEVLQD
jgi:hypothetical protein